MANAVTGLRLPDDVRQWLRQKTVDFDTTLTAVVTAVVRARIAAEAPARLSISSGDAAGRVCPGCGAPRTPSDDPIFTALEHIQCDQSVAALDADASEGAGAGRG